MFKTIAIFYAASAKRLIYQIEQRDQPVVAAKVAGLEKIGSKVTKSVESSLPQAVREVLANKDAQFEVKKGDLDGKIVPNTDLGVIEGAHYPYLIEIAKAASERQNAKTLSKKTQTPAGQIADSMHIESLSKRKVTLFGKDVQISPMKLVALLKATHLDQLRKIGDDPVVVCGSGHWVRVTDLEGDHAFPDSILVQRFFYVFGEEYDVKTHGEPLDLLPAVYKAQSGDKVAANKALLMAHYLDAKNLMPLCSDCNGNKNANYLNWFINHPRYGVGFVTANFPLNYNTIVPRTKDGQGLGDAAMMYLYTQKALQAALFPIKTEVKLELGADDQPIDLAQAKAIIFTRAKGKLTEEEFAQLAHLLSKV